MGLTLELPLTIRYSTTVPSVLKNVSKVGITRILSRFGNGNAIRARKLPNPTDGWERRQRGRWDAQKDDPG